MNFYIFLLFVGIVIFFYSKLNKIRDTLNFRIDMLEKKILELRHPDTDRAEGQKEKYAEPEEKVEQKQKTEAQEKPSVVIPPEIKPEKKYEPITQTHVLKLPPSLPVQQTDESIAVEEDQKAESGKKPEKTKSDWAVRWKKFKENVDWEQFTGKKISAWLGGLSLFIAAGFFVKYSIDNNLIPLSLRLAAGALAGIAMIIVSHWIKNEKYTVMRYTLVSCGIGVLYAIIYAAIYYQFITKPIGFAFLTLVSATAFVLAVYYKGVAISVMGVIGANITPIIVSTGSGDIVMLFAYLAIVNIGVYQVVRYLKSQMLLLTACAGTLITLSLGIISYYYKLPGHTIACVWVANLALFSVFLGWSNIDPEENQTTRWMGRLLYISALIMAAVLIVKTGWGALFILTASVSGAIILAHRNRGWYADVIPFSVVTFIIAFIWAVLRFNPQYFSFNLVLFLLYGVAGGLGPILLIKKYGFDKKIIHWFRLFPVSIVAISMIGFFRAPVISFWFWPMLLCLQLLGIGISLLVKAFIQICLLVLLFIACGLYWVFNFPQGVLGFGFFGFILFSGILLSVAIFVFIKKLPDILADSFPERVLPEKESIDLKAKNLEQWIVATPAVGAFVLLGAAFIVKHPYFPHPGMLTMVCFLVLTLFLSKRIMFQPPAVLALLASVFTQAIWVMSPNKDMNLLFAAVAWSSGLFCCALIVPFLGFKEIEKWKQIFNAWALFEVFQGVFVLYSTSLYWNDPLMKWTPLVLALFKLPVVSILIKRLKDKEERNTILAFHGGALLFYISALPVIVLNHGWIGIAFVFEAAALLWLNRRIEHPGLRWTASFLAPAGLIILFINIPLLKVTDSMSVINSAVISVAASIIALGAAVKLSSYPDRTIGKKLDLPEYFLWLAVGTGFYLVNLIISDLFATHGTKFMVFPGKNYLHWICYALTWTAFGAILWRRRALPTIMCIVGLCLSFAGAFVIIILPALLPKSIGHMRPFFNPSFISYLMLMAIMYYLFIKEPLKESGFGLKNTFLAIFLVSGFMLLKLSSATILQPGLSFELFHSSTAPKALASAVGWFIYGLGLLLWPKRLDRPFRFAGVILILLGIIKTLFFPYYFRAEFGDMTPLLNLPSLLFLFVISSLVYLTLRNWKQLWPITDFQPRAFLGVILAVVTFTVLNIEIASAFALKGRPFSMLTHGSLSMQLAYSIGWLVFSIGLMIVGIKWDNIKVRWAAIILLVGTSVKIFTLDLWKLGQLYRVGAFVGLAVVLILVSFLYQRFLSGEKQNET
ncbi:MAG: DUF2339 domain-containing protein [Pseudomonadota bacterium]